MARRRLRAFTIIELLIAIGLSVSVLLLAVVGLRVAAQTATACNLLSVENQVIQAGFLRACDEADFWVGLDDPDDAGRQALRGYRGTAGAVAGPTPFVGEATSGAFDAEGKVAGCPGGLPFTPFTTCDPLVRADVDAESSTGWDGDDPWRWNDPRTWWRGDFPQKFASDLRYGRYSIFSNVAAKAPIGPSSSYGTVAVPHRWLANQIWGLHDAIGYYGFIDYMPANALFSCSGPCTPTTSGDGVPNLFIACNTRFVCDCDVLEWTRSRTSLTSNVAYVVESPWDPVRPGAARATGNLVTDEQFWYMVGGAGVTGFRGWGNYDFNYVRRQNDQMLRDSGYRVDLLPQRPAHWPTGEVSVHRIIKDSRFVTLCRVHMFNPLTGHAVELPFTVFATSLRGARQQRRHPDAGGGWARWDDAVDAVNDRTLDSP